MRAVTNAEIAAALEELGVLYELDGAVKYRVLAYGAAAKAIRESPVSVAELAAAGRATEIPGVGKTLAEKIDALLETGEIPAAAKLKAKFPPTLIEVTRVPGLGAKTARRLFDELGVASLEDLKAAAGREQIREVEGPRAEGRGKRARGARAARRARRGPRAACCSRRSGRSPRSWPRRCASTRPPTGSRSPARCGAGPRPARTST